LPHALLGEPQAVIIPIRINEGLRRRAIRPNPLSHHGVGVLTPCGVEAVVGVSVVLCTNESASSNLPPQKASRVSSRRGPMRWRVCGTCGTTMVRFSPSSLTFRRSIVPVWYNLPPVALGLGLTVHYSAVGFTSRREHHRARVHAGQSIPPGALCGGEDGAPLQVRGSALAVRPPRVPFVSRALLALAYRTPISEVDVCKLRPACLSRMAALLGGFELGFRVRINAWLHSAWGTYRSRQGGSVSRVEAAAVAGLGLRLHLAQREDQSTKRLGLPLGSCRASVHCKLHGR